MADPPLALVADLHPGSTLALWPENFELKDESTKKLNRPQKWLLQCWRDFCTKVPKGSVGHVIGDVTQGINLRDSDLMSFRRIDHENAATELLEPFVDRCSEVQMYYGTEWHEFAGGEMTDQIYQNLRTTFPGRIHKPVQDFWQKWNGYIIHFAHHRGISKSPVSKGTMLLAPLIRMLVNAPRRGGLYPDIVVRAHAHDPGYIKCQYGIAIGLAGWQLKTRHVWKSDSESVPAIGGTILRMNKGDLIIWEKIYPIEKPKPHRLRK